MCRDSEYIFRLARFLRDEYCIKAADITPAKRGFYGETWRLDSTDESYFVKLVYPAAYAAVYERSFHVIEHLCNHGIDFISKIIKTKDGGRYFIVAWDNPILAPLERDAWVMCSRDWAREAFQRALRQNNIEYAIRNERLAYYCYQFFFFYLISYINGFTQANDIQEIEAFIDGWIKDSFEYADRI
jgi:hypothetical protein